MTAVAHATGSGLALTGQAGATARIVEPMKTCTGPCGRRLPWSAYYASNKWPDGTMRNPQGKCKECQLQYNANRRRGNRDHLDKHNRRERARRKTFTHAQRESIRVNGRWARRRREDIPEERWRVHEESDHLDAAPFAKWLAEEADRRGSVRAVARATGIDDSQVHRIIVGTQVRVTREMVDQALLKSPTGLWELYPDA